MAQDICDREEPDLLAVDGSGHAAACHFRSRVADVEAADLFGTDAGDEVPVGVQGPTGTEVTS
jgi:hypothetical protein